MTARALLDLACIVGAHAGTTYLLRPDSPSWSRHIKAQLPFLALVVLLWLVVAAKRRLFQSQRTNAFLPQVFGTAWALLAWIVLTVVVASFWGPTAINRDELFVSTLAAAALILAGRAAFRLGLWDLRRHGFNVHHAVIVGANQCTDHLVRVVQSSPQFGWYIEGFLENDPSRRNILERYGVRYLGPIEELERLLVDRVVDSVYVSLPLKSHYNTVQRIVNLCEGIGVPVRMVADLFPLRVAVSAVRSVGNLPVVSLAPTPGRELHMTLKRAAEFVLSSILLIVSAPLMLVIAAVIKSESPGPILTYQWRLSRKRLPFKMRRFRTTRGGPAAPAATETRIGGFLRRYRLENLPQLVHVWRGEMALVGASPLSPEDPHPCQGCARCWTQLEPAFIRRWSRDLGWVGCNTSPDTLPETRNAPTHDVLVPTAAAETGD